MFNLSDLASRNRFNPNPTRSYSPTNRGFFGLHPSLSSINPQTPQFLTPNFTTIDPFGLNRLANIRQLPPVDLELRLGQVGHTISYQDAMRTRMVPSPRTNHNRGPERSHPVSKKLDLTLGYRTWLSRGRGPATGGSRTRTRGCNKKEHKKCEVYGPHDLDLNKKQGDADDEIESEGSSSAGTSSNKKRDYYGPCNRCGMTFDISQRYASHMRIHYRLDETEEEKMVRLSKKRSRRS